MRRMVSRIGLTVAFIACAAVGCKRTTEPPPDPTSDADAHDISRPPTGRVALVANAEQALAGRLHEMRKSD